MWLRCLLVFFPQFSLPETLFIVDILGFLRRQSGSFADLLDGIHYFYLQAIDLELTLKFIIVYTTIQEMSIAFTAV